jgi:hypothetical protein
MPHSLLTNNCWFLGKGKHVEKHIEVHITNKLTNEEWDILRRFCEKSNRLASTKLGSKEGAGIREKIRYEKDKGLWFESELPPEEQISEFLMAFRFFYLQKEVTHFPKVIGIIGKHTVNQDARKALKVFGKQWQDSLFGKAINIQLNDSPITTSLLLDLWFNAHYFHADEVKEKELEKLTECFSNEFAKFMLLEAVFEATKAVFKLFNGLQGIVYKHNND